MRIGGEIGASEGLWFSLLNWRGALTILVIGLLILSTLMTPHSDAPVSTTTLILRYLPLAVFPGVWIFLLWKIRSVRLKAGLPARYPITYDVKPEGLSLSSPLGVSESRWPAIARIAPSSRYWVIHIAGSKLIVPKRFFATPADERAFLAETLGHMTAPARARSAAAARFAARE